MVPEQFHLAGRICGSGTHGRTISQLRRASLGKSRGDCTSTAAPGKSRVEKPAIPITQKLLVSAGGWPAMKQAQQMQKAGRVLEAEYTPPLLSGVVREGNRNLRSGLRVQTESDVENICTCREAREWGKICPHALAVGLEFMDRNVLSTQVAKAASARAIDPPPPG